jgi:hypothetical protein
MDPLTPNEIPPHNYSLPRFLTGEFNLECLLLQKKAYLIGFSFKFKEIKFCSLSSSLPFLLDRVSYQCPLTG